MRVNAISNVPFQKVFAVSGTREQVDKIKSEVHNSEGKGLFIYATDLYKQDPQEGLCTKAVQEGKEVAFVVCGKKAFNSVYYFNQGWGTLRGISKKLDEFVNLDEDDKNVVKNIKQEMLK